MKQTIVIYKTRDLPGLPQLVGGRCAHARHRRAAIALIVRRESFC